MHCTAQTVYAVIKVSGRKYERRRKKPEWIPEKTSYPISTALRASIDRPTPAGINTE
jgi:hypothetical protein